MIRHALAFIGIVASAPTTYAQAVFPSTPTEFYEAGQQFASCSAYHNYVAGLARDLGLDDAAAAYEGMERGWRLAGTMLLVEGLHESRQIDVERIFEDLQENKIIQIRADRQIIEAQGGVYNAADRFETECGEWSDMQRSIIQALRSGPTG